VTGFAQTRTDSPQEQKPEVVRINTDLVQSPVMVFDKQGHFVEGLQREQFELRVAGEPQAITFFDRVTAGTSAESVKREAARKGLPAVPEMPKGTVYGRTIIFFIDDLHLAAESIYRTRAALLKFIDEQMGQNDRVLITTGSGQLGFLQQLTDNKDVLRIAANKLRPRDFLVQDNERPPMGPYQALSIETGDQNVMKYYVEIYFADFAQNMNKEAPALPGNKNAAADAQFRGESARRQAEAHVRGRARNILNQYTAITASSFLALKYLMASTVQLSGSKLIFLISDGFLLNRNVGGESQKQGEITSAAVRAGAIIYSIQASGLSSAYPDAKTDLRQGSRMPMELPRVTSDAALQAPLNTLAVDTGGRALFNSNSMEGSIRQALAETSEYYLLGWRPPNADQRSESFKEIQVVVKDHPELTVRVHKGYLTAAANSIAEKANSPSKSDDVPSNHDVKNPEQPEQKLTEALSNLYAVTDLLVSVNARYSDVPNSGAQLMIGTEIPTADLFQTTEDKRSHLLDVMGVVLNENGKTVASFKGQLTAEANPLKPSISQTTEVKVKPGVYQVRVGARDEMTGKTGTAIEWLVVPDLSERKLALSSLFLGDHKQEPGAEAKVPLSINHHFSADSRLRFFVSVYNASQANGKPDVSLQTQIFRDGRAIFTGPEVKPIVEGSDDLARLPYAAEISLRTLQPGAYVLQLTATDHLAKSVATQRVRFIVE
jgi:VWFA-related protein